MLTKEKNYFFFFCVGGGGGGGEADGTLLTLPLVFDEEPVGGSPFCCEPLAMIGPTGTEDVGRGCSKEPSVWVKQRHRGFYKLVGFLIESHEQECLALLQRIEADRF